MRIQVMIILLLCLLVLLFSGATYMQLLKYQMNSCISYHAIGSVVTIPEPSALALSGTGFLWWAVNRRL